MKKRIFFLILLFGILFPFAALTRYSAVYARLFNPLFGTPAAHVIMHAVLFAALSLCVMGLLADRPRRQAALLAMVTVVFAAVGQEIIQMISNGYPRWGDSLFDLCVDVLAAGIAVGVACFKDKG